jgi:hypothetical protein
MEHRCGTRHRVDLEVDIRLGPRRVGKGQLSELSLSGAFVSTPFAVALPRGFVALDVVFADQLLQSEQIVQGHLVRHTEEGLALEWNEFAPEPVCRVLARQRTPRSMNRGAPPTEDS